MKQRDNILQELNELGSQLSTHPLQNSYTVPAGYFDGLVAQVMNRIKALEATNAADELNHLSPVLGKLSKQTPYVVPAGYFETLDQKIMSGIRESNDYTTAKEETASLSPLLAGLKKENPYQVPQGYFETLSPVRETKVPAKVVSIGSRKWLRYAAAAVITGVIIMTGFLIFNNGDKKETGGKALAKMTRDIKKMNEVQKNDMIDFLSVGMDGTETAEVNTTNKSKEIQQLLQDVPEEELKNFQEQTEDLEEVLMIN